MEDAQPSVHELRDKFNKLNLIARSKSRSSSINNESSYDLSHSEKQKSEDYSIASLIKNPVLSSSDNVAAASSSPNEASAALAAILNQSQQKDENQKPTSRKPPIPPPRPTNPIRKNSVTTESSSSIPHHSSTMPVYTRRKPPVPLPPSAKQKRSKSVDEEQSPSSSSSTSPDLPSNETVSSQVEIPDVSNSTDEYESIEPSSISQDEPLNETDTFIPPPEINQKQPKLTETSVDDTENPYWELNNDDTLNSSFSDDEDDPYYDHATQISIPISNGKSEQENSNVSMNSIETILPSKCMFYDFETRINNYQRRNPRTILCPTIKPTMPKITTNEIDILQRCSNM